MTLYLIGLGLNDENDITLKGLELVKKADKAYLEGYTSTLSCSKEDLERKYGRKLLVADRELVEKGEEILDNAAKGDVALLVGGDPMSATTHTDLVLRAAKRGIKVEVVHNASVLTAVGVVGLELYKYGKTTSITFPQEGWDVQTFYDVVKENKSRGLHTLCLLDIKVKEPSKEALKKGDSAAFEKPMFMTISQGIQCLLDVEKKRKENVFTDETLCVGCARLGSKDMKIKAGKARDIVKEDFGKPLHCLVVPGKLHFVEEEALELWKKA
jgi:diphthine synthase